MFPANKYFSLILAGLAISSACLAEYRSSSGQTASELLCCEDANGRRACGDILPEQCIGRAYKVYNRQGILVKEVGPPLTPEQKTAKLEELRRQKAAEAAQKEQRRKDQALLETYSSLQDIDKMRARAEADVKTTITNAETQIAEARNRRLKYEREAEFYPNKALPPDVAKGLRDEDTEIRSLTELLESKKRDMNLIREKYDEDRRRYIELSRRPISPQPPR